MHGRRFRGDILEFQVRLKSTVKDLVKRKKYRTTTTGASSDECITQ